MKINIALLTVIVTLAAPASLRGQTFITGMDGAHYQGNINWPSVAGAGVKFAFMKATQGNSYVDPTFAANMAGANANGVLVGPYHFCDLDTDTANPDDAINEANHFLDVIKPYYDNGLYLPPVADVEGFPDFASQTEARNFTSTWVQKFSDRINTVLGVRPIIYTSLSKATGSESYYTPAISSTHELWLAWWKGTGTTNPPVASNTPNWGIWQFWQWTDSFPVNGITTENPDGDVYAGTIDQLKALRIGKPPGPVTTISNFDIDEGYFNWSTTFSGSNQNILATSTADRVTTTAHWGAGSEKIFADTSAATWVMRFVSGLGSPAANPTTNLHLPATGSVGFWLKTTDAGVTTQILIDDKADNSSIEGGTVKSVIADGEWHLYEWKLDDATQWNNYSGGDGTITEPSVTIDAIRFTGTHDSTFYLDDVLHNPAGSLVPLPGDFDHNYTVDKNDLSEWEADFGTSTAGADFLAWQQGATQSAVAAPLAAPVPEPTSIALLQVVLAASVDAWRRSRR